VSGVETDKLESCRTLIACRPIPQPVNDSGSSTICFARIRGLSDEYGS
jgi:hypothetical protein